MQIINYKLITHKINVLFLLVTENKEVAIPILLSDFQVSENMSFSAIDDRGREEKKYIQKYMQLLLLNIDMHIDCEDKFLVYS